MFIRPAAPVSPVQVTIPLSAKVPSMSNVNPWEVRHMADSASPETMTAATIAPARGSQHAEYGFTSTVYPSPWDK